eukprot:scaffold725_cov133-Cylindrotheca_fusiformis.AAC.2
MIWTVHCQLSSDDSPFNLFAKPTVDTELSGTFPTQFGEMVSLETLNLDDNRLKGEIPSHIGKMESLVNISLSLNSFSGTLTPQIAQADNIAEIRFCKS